MHERWIMKENKYRVGKETSHKLFLETGDLGYYFLSKGFESLEMEKNAEKSNGVQPEM